MGSSSRGAFLSVLALCSACLLTPPALAPGLDVVRYPLDRATLANGARVVVENAPDFGLAGVVVVVHAGSGDEAADKSGLAHLVEHLLFRAKHQGRRLEERFEELGAATWNGSTSWDETNLYAFVPSSNLSALLALMVDVLDDPLASIDDADFVHEQRTVRNEERLRTEPGTPGQAWGLLSEEVFPAGHPYAHTTSGTDRSIDGLTLADVRAFVASHYRPANVTLVVSAPFPVDSELERVRTAVAGHSWATTAETSSPTPRASQPDPFSRPRAPLTSHELPGATPTLWIGWPIPPVYGPDGDCAMLLSELVPGVFWRHLRDRDSDIASVSAGVEDGTEASMFVLQISLNEGRDPKASADSAIFTMQKGLTELATDVFEVHKRFGASRFLNGEEDMVSRAIHLATSADLTQTPTYLRNQSTRIAALKRGDVMDFRRRYLTPERAHAMFVRSPADPAAARTDLAKSGTTGPAPDLDEEPPASPPEIAELRSWMHAGGFGEARHTTLDSGLEVIALRRPGSPFTTALLAYHGGDATGSPAGVATASQWALSRTGMPPGVLGVSHVAKTDQDTTMEVLHSPGSDVGLTIRQVKWAAEFSVYWPPPQFTDRLASFQLEDQQPAAVLSRRLWGALFGSHPYGRTPTADDIHGVSPRDVNVFLDAVRRPENGVLVLVGDIDPAQAFAVAARELRERGFAKPPVAAPPPLEDAAAQAGSRLLVQPRPNSSNTDLTFLCLLPKRDAVDPANGVFGTMLGAVLRGGLREGLTASYGVTHRVSVFRGGTALLELQADLADDRLASALLRIRHFVESPAAGTWDDAALARARAKIARSWNLSLDSTERQARWITSLWNMGWPIDDRFPEELLRVDVGGVVERADHCRNNWVLGLVGDESRIQTALAGWNP
jgi:zinc protease